MEYIMHYNGTMLYSIVLYFIAHWEVSNTQQ